MSLSDEWEEVHLTPSGWVSGSYKHDFGDREERATPADAVLTVRRHVTVGAIGARANIDEVKTPLTDDAALIADLYAKYGKPRFTC